MATPARNSVPSSDPFADLRPAQRAAIKHGTEAEPDWNGFARARWPSIAAQPLRPSKTTATVRSTQEQPVTDNGSGRSTPKVSGVGPRKGVGHQHWP